MFIEEKGNLELLKIVNEIVAKHEQKKQELINTIDKAYAELDKLESEYKKIILILHSRTQSI